MELIQEKSNPTVIGLDPRPELLPPQLIEQAIEKTRSTLEYSGLDGEGSQEGQDQVEAVWAHHLAQAYLQFNLAILDGVADLVPAVKPQIAMYEALGPSGIKAYTTTCRAAADRGLYVIGDIKRGDIGSTASAYASHLTGLPLTWQQATSAGTPGQEEVISAQGPHFPWYQNAITLNPYLGWDGLEPFVRAAEQTDGDLFVLVRTSNPSSNQLQELPLAGDTQAPELFFEHLGSLVEEWGSETRGSQGYSRLGAVVGATQPQAGARLRESMPHTFFLVPGYGSQGGTAQDVAPMFDQRGQGAIVNSSRGIISAWKRNPSYTPALSAQATLHMVAQDARKAAQAMKEDLNEALKEAR